MFMYFSIECGIVDDSHDRLERTVLSRPPGFPSDSPEGSVVEVHDGHPHPRPHKARRHCAAHPLPAARDDGHLAVQSRCAHETLFTVSLGVLREHGTEIGAW